MMKMLTFAGTSHIGKVRKDNQDRFLTRSLSDEVGFAVVCDGMGGANGGSVASTMATETIAEILLRDYRSEQTDEEIDALLIRSCAAANAEIFRRSQREAELEGMGTTAVIALVCKNKAHILHVGDSRAYRLSGGALSQITSDHSMVQELVDSGEITAEAAKTHPQKNIITRAVGVDGFITCDCDTVPFEEGDILLLCTDGLTNMVSDKEIGKLAGKKDPERLVNAALNAGGNDNITVVLIY